MSNSEYISKLLLDVSNEEEASSELSESDLELMRNLYKQYQLESKMPSTTEKNNQRSHRNEVSNIRMPIDLDLLRADIRNLRTDNRESKFSSEMEHSQKPINNDKRLVEIGEKELITGNLFHIPPDELNRIILDTTDFDAISTSSLEENPPQQYQYRSHKNNNQTTAVTNNITDRQPPSGRSNERPVDRREFNARAKQLQFLCNEFNITKEQFMKLERKELALLFLKKTFGPVESIVNRFHKMLFEDEDEEQEEDDETEILFQNDNTANSNNSDQSKEIIDNQKPKMNLNDMDKVSEPSRGMSNCCFRQTEDKKRTYSDATTIALEDMNKMKNTEDSTSKSLAHESNPQSDYSADDSDTSDSDEDENLKFLLSSLLSSINEMQPE